VVLLRLRLAEQLAEKRLPKGLADARDKPLPASAFSNRFAFDPEQLRGSAIADFLKDRYCLDPADAPVPAEAAAVAPGAPWDSHHAYSLKRPSRALVVQAHA
jgi:hypothetical protein